MSTTAINNALALRFPRASHALLWEVAPSTQGTRYADAVAVGLWASHGHMIQGIEVKASRSDFQREMQQPDKSEAVMRFCHRWWLACPKGLVQPSELPPTWGMLELVGDVLRVKVKAPVLKPVPPTLAFFASLCRRQVGGDEAMFEARIATEVQRLAKAESERAKRNQERDLTERVIGAEKGMQAIEAIKAETGIDVSEWRASDDIVAAIKAYRMVNGSSWANSLRGLRSAHAAALKAIDDAGFFKVSAP